MKVYILLHHMNGVGDLFFGVHATQKDAETAVARYDATVGEWNKTGDSVTAKIPNSANHWRIQSYAVIK